MKLLELKTMNLGASVRVNKIGIGIIVASVVILYLLYRGSGESGTTEFKAPPGPVSLKHLLAAAIDAAEQGGKKVYEIRMSADLNEKSKGKTLEGANNPITDGDTLSHTAMFYSLRKSFPNVEVISEEHDPADMDLNKVIAAKTSHAEVNGLADKMVPSEDIRIWIDPLDATQEYTEKLLQYVTTMVCVAVDGVPVIGVIHKPFENFTAWGWAPGHVTTKLKVAENGGLPKDDIAHIIVSRSHSGQVEEVAKNAFGDKTNIIKAGGAGYKTLEVITGKADAYVHVTLIKKWDLCAGHAILNALNGDMTTLDGRAIDYSNKEAYKNEGGVLATLHEHEYYKKKLEALKS